MEIFLTNTLTGVREKFEPINSGKVSLYCCGPTVYNYAHIGNFRTFLFADVLARTFDLLGYEVTKVQNITDVGHLTQDDLADAQGEDKMLKAARRENRTVWEIAKFYTDAFVEDEELLRIKPPAHRPRATEFIDEQIALIQTMIERGYAYEKDGSVYFAVEKFREYGALSKNDLSQLQAAVRTDPNDDKQSSLDFALWKSAPTEHLMQWESPWGIGFPGWHIECSAMSRALLGDHFDIHTGGEDNLFPHHECEIAQNQTTLPESDKNPAVRYWLHAKHLLVDGQKMSKSGGNFFTIRDLQQEDWTGAEIRLALISGHYRTALNFSRTSLEQARQNIRTLRQWHQELIALEKTPAPNDLSNDWQQKFRAAIADDLNIAEALGVIFSAKKEWQKQKKAAIDFLSLLQDFDAIFAILTPEKEDEKIVLSPEDKDWINTKTKQRDQSRADENWEQADEIKSEIETKFPTIKIADVPLKKFREQQQVSQWEL